MAFRSVAIRKKRYHEFEKYLHWLLEIIEKENIEILLIAGDIFDTTTPSNKAQKLYYKFLNKVSMSKCRYVIIIAGNHDSPSFLNAPKELLDALDVFVVGSVSENLEDEIFVLSDENTEKMIVCAVPYLRDCDIRKNEAGESLDDKKNKFINGIKQHYIDVCKIAEKKQKEIDLNIPIIAMGHLFTSKGKVSDGVREIYVGSLTQINKSSFPDSIDYLALGHLHVPQLVDKANNMRYCGSPLPMSFGEATQHKNVLKINFKGKTPSVKEILIPCFQKLRQIKGDMDKIISEIEKYKLEDENIWLEIIYNGDKIASDLTSQLEEHIANSKLEILRIQNRRIVEQILKKKYVNETLNNLTETDVFERCLDSHEINEDEKDELRLTYQDTIQLLNETDTNKD